MFLKIKIDFYERNTCKVKFYFHEIINILQYADIYKKVEVEIGPQWGRWLPP